MHWRVFVRPVKRMFSPRGVASDFMSFNRWVSWGGGWDEVWWDEVSRDRENKKRGVGLVGKKYRELVKLGELGCIV